MLADAAEAGSHDGKSNEGIPSDNPAFCTLAAHGICNETRESFFRGEIYQSGGFLGGIFGIKNHFALYFSQKSSNIKIYIQYFRLF